MQQWLTGEDLVNLLAMLRTVDSRVFMILEGMTDCQALDSHVDEEVAATFPAHSKSAAELAIELADLRRIDKVIAILDRDWVGFLESALLSPNIVYTDDYDLDATMLFSGSVMKRVIASHSDRESRTTHLVGADSSAAELITEIAAVAGIMRYVSVRRGMHINCQKLPVHMALTKANDAVDLEMLSTIALGRSNHAEVTHTTLVTAVQEERANITDVRPFCNGHDLVAAMAVVLKQWGGSASQLGIAQAVRGAFSCADLRVTGLYSGVSSGVSERV